MPVQHVGYLMKNISDKMKVRADADLKNHNLTMTQSRVLAFLDSRGGQATQKEIGSFLAVAHPTVVGIVTRMEQNGFLTTWFDAQDRRSKIVALTDHAKKISRELSVMINEQEERILSGLDERQIRELVAALETICKNLD